MERSLLLRDVLVGGERTDVLVRGNRYADLHAAPGTQADETLDGGGVQALLPAFYNLHTHAAMTLLRGYADDLELFDWLRNHIWPAEARLTEEDVHWGTRLAILEMLRSGTVFMNDMYWHQAATVDAAEEMGFRAAVGYMYICVPGGGVLESNRRANDRLRERAADVSGRIMLTHAPHAVYTVGEETLLRVRDLALSEGAILHMHAAETRKEVADCLKEHGKTPVEYLHSLGMLGPRTVLAHCVHLTDEEIGILARTRTVIAHNPVSNLKLCSGLFRFRDALRAKCRIALGTDGCASNNNASMLEEMKFAALSAKAQSGSPTAGRDEDVYRMATSDAAAAAGLDAGAVAEGRLADGILVDVDSPLLVGDYHPVANLVYSADSSVVRSVICDGRIVMRDRHVPGQEEIIERCRRICRRLA